VRQETNGNTNDELGKSKIEQTKKNYPQQHEMCELCVDNDSELSKELCC